MAMHNPIVFKRKTTFMQRISDYAGKGYIHWVSGECAPEKGLALAQKFADHYRVDLDANARFQRKKHGLGNAVWLLWRSEQAPADAPISWVLMVTDSDHPAHKLERLHSVVDDKIEVTGYELVRQPRGGNDKPSWTWRMTKERENEWRHDIERVTKKGSMKEAAALFFNLYNCPGFAGVRSQVGTLLALWRAAWKRHRRPSERFFAPRKLYYLSRLPDDGPALSKLAARVPDLPHSRAAGHAGRPS